MLKHKQASAYRENYDAIADVLAQNELLKCNQGVEVGVRSGVFTEFLLDRFPSLQMNLVDPYAAYMDVNNAWFTQEMQEEIYQGALLRLERFGDRKYFFRETSVAAAEYMQLASCDFVFIDAIHEYPHVKADLEAWFENVRPGGLFCGHDYNFPEVKRAVDEFAAAKGLEVVHIGFPAHVWLMEVGK